MRKKLTLSIKLLLSVFMLIYMSSGSVFAQSSYTLKGRVLDDKGNGLPGASIKIEGTSQGTVADASGAFAVTLNGPATLTVSFISFVNKTVKVTSANKIIDITLAENGRQLNDVVIVMVHKSKPMW